MKNKLTLFTKWLLDFMYYAGILTTVLVPVIIYFYGKYNPYFSIHILSLSVIFMLSGILAVLIIRELRRLFLSVLNDNCFIHENVRSLNRMGTYSFFIALITCCLLVIILTFVIAGLFSKVLSQVFDRAVTYKLENDLTI